MFVFVVVRLISCCLFVCLFVCLLAFVLFMPRASVPLVQRLVGQHLGPALLREEVLADPAGVLLIMILINNAITNGNHITTTTTTTTTTTATTNRNTY